MIRPTKEGPLSLPVKMMVRPTTEGPLSLPVKMMVRPTKEGPLSLPDLSKTSMTHFSVRSPSNPKWVM